MRINFNFQKLLKIISTPLFIFAFTFNTNAEFNKVNANTKIKAAKVKDLDLYQGMGVSYLCNATRKGMDIEFEKSLSVSASTFLTVVQELHGGMIVIEKKEEKIDPRIFFERVSFGLAASALDACPDSVPEKYKKEIKKEINRINKLNKK